MVWEKPVTGIVSALLTAMLGLNDLDGVAPHDPI